VAVFSASPTKAQLLRASRGRAEAESRGRAEAESRGRAEAESRGRAEGEADSLRKLLMVSFGKLTEGTEFRLTSANEAELDRWIERVLGAHTLEAIPELEAILGV
jgi:hypothetical protein